MCTASDASCHVSRLSSMLSFVAGLAEGSSHLGRVAPPPPATCFTALMHAIDKFVTFRPEVGDRGDSSGEFIISS